MKKISEKTVAGTRYVIYKCTNEKCNHEIARAE